MQRCTLAKEACSDLKSMAYMMGLKFLGNPSLMCVWKWQFWRHNDIILLNVGSYFQNFSDKAMWINLVNSRNKGNLLRWCFFFSHLGSSFLLGSNSGYRLVGSLPGPPRFFTNLASMSPRAFLSLSHESWVMMLKVLDWGKKCHDMSCICMYIEYVYIIIFICTYNCIYIYINTLQVPRKHSILVEPTVLLWYPCRFMVSLPSGIRLMFVHWSSTGHLRITDLTCFTMSMWHYGERKRGSLRPCFSIDFNEWLMVFRSVAHAALSFPLSLFCFLCYDLFSFAYAYI